jgi:hypothetical protein
VVPTLSSNTQYWWAPVLPTSGKEFRPIQLKVRPLAKEFGRTQYLLLGAVLQALLPQIRSKNSGVNPWVGQSISSNNQGLYVKYTHQKKFGHFSAIF